MAPNDPQRSAFSNFSAGVFEGRWGSVIGAIAAIIPLESVLRRTWNEQAYGAHGGHRQQANGHDINLQLISEAIASDMFWAYLRMLDALQECLDRLQAWSESCFCHWPRNGTGLQGAHRHFVKAPRVRLSTAHPGQN